MRRCLFITGTGTDVGKTIATGALLHALRLRGIRAAGMKPVQTGALCVDGRWHAPDLDLHLEAMGESVEDADYERMALYRYEPACSPHLAGRRAGHYPELSKILDRAGVPVTGLVFNELQPGEPDLIARDNPEVVARLGGAPVLGVLSHRPSPPHDWRAWAGELTGLDRVIEALQ